MLVIIIQLAILASNRLANFTGSELQLSTSVTTTQYYITNTRRKLIRAANISLYRKAALRVVGRRSGSPAAPKSYRNGCRWALLAPLLTLWCSISTPKPYGSVLDLIKKHLDITDKPVVVEIDGHSVEELLKVGKVFTNLSDRIILKIPCSVNGFKAFSILKDERLRPSAPRFLPDPGGRCSPSRGRPYPALLRSGQGRRWRPDPTDTRVCADVQWLDTATNISWLRLSAQWRQRMRTVYRDMMDQSTH